MNTFIQDSRFALRLILKNRSLTLAVIVSLSLGIGATATVFSLVDSFLLRPLAVSETDRVVRITSATQTNRVGPMSYPDVEDFQLTQRSFTGLTTYRNIPLGLSTAPGQQARTTIGASVNGNFFDVLGIEPTIGRGFRPEEDEVSERDLVAVISHSLWQREYGGSPDISGQTIRLNSKEFTIVGVAPKSFSGPELFVRPEVYVPHRAIRETAVTDRKTRAAQVYARLKPEISVTAAQEDVRRIGEMLEERYPDSNKGFRASVFSQLDFRLAESPEELTLAAILLTVAILVLGIACVNVANLLFSTAPVRTREMAMKVALGANRFRLVRQLLLESLIVALGGTIVGLGIAAVCSHFLSSIQFASNLPLKLDTRIDFRVVLFALGVGLASGVISGLVPALRCSRTNLNSLLRSTDSRLRSNRMWTRRALVAGQVTVSVIVLILSGLMIRDLRLSRKADPGFRVDRLVTMSFNPAGAQYNLEQTRTFYRQLLSRFRTIPGVEAAGFGQHIPLGVSSTSASLSIDGFQMAPDQQWLSIQSDYVSDGYFDAIGIPIVRGRAFSMQDISAAPRVAVVNEAMARKYWPGRDPIGARVQVQGRDGGPAEVIGIARDAKYRDLDEKELPFIYFAVEQSGRSMLTLFVATAGTAPNMISRLRSEASAVDPNQPVYDARTMTEHFEQQALLSIRLVAQVITGVGAVGFVLGIIGLYAILAYSVSQRTREIGIRMAIGETKAGVLRMVLQEGLKLTIIGISVGLAMTLALTSVLKEMLVTVSPRDPMVYAVTVVLLVVVNMTACYFPARRASSVDPNVALRGD